MNRTSIFRTLILAGAVISSAVSAGSDIVKCIDAEGNVTLTDAACPGSARTAPVIVGNSEPDESPVAGTPQAFEAVAAERYSAPRLARRELPVVKAKFGKGALARDVATLKAARENLHLLDSAAQAMRAQRIAQQ